MWLVAPFILRAQLRERQTLVQASGRHFGTCVKFGSPGGASPVELKLGPDSVSGRISAADRPLVSYPRG
jgi:hypothetical protein